MTIAYLRHIGSYSGNADVFNSLFTKLDQWVGQNGVIYLSEKKYIIVYL